MDALGQPSSWDTEPQVEVVIANYMRPRNVAAIAAAFLDQSKPCIVTIVDCHESEDFALPERVHRAVDRVVRVTNDFGSFSRYVPAFGFSRPYTYVHDDDMLPGRRVVEHFLRAARSCPGFGVLGQFGRILPRDGLPYVPIDVKRTSVPRLVDMVVRGYFLRTDCLHHLLRMRWEMGLHKGALHDDILLSCSLKLFGGLKACLTPTSSDPEESINLQELPDEHAYCRRPDHAAVRTDYLRRIRKLGWRSLADEPGATA